MILSNCVWILIYFSLFSCTEAFEKQMKINLLKDYLKFENNVRFMVHVCFKIAILGSNLKFKDHPNHLLLQISLRKIEFENGICSLTDLQSMRQLTTNKQVTLVNNPSEFINDNQDHLMIRVLDLDCPDAKNILLKANATKHFTFPNRWLFLLGVNTSAISESLLLDIDSDVITAKIYNEEIIHMKQPYKYNKYETFLVYEMYGFWTKAGGIFDQRTKKIKTHRRRNLNGQVLRQSYSFISMDSFNHLHHFIDKQIDSNGKHSFHVNKLLAYYVNATQRVEPAKGWGRLLPNGTWTGVVGKIYRGENEVSGSGLVYLPNRLPYIRYLGRVSKSRASFIFRMPALSFVSNILRLSFQTKLWISLGILLLLTMSVIKYLFTVEVHRKEEKDIKYNVESLSLQKGWASMGVFLVGSLCQQGNLLAFLSLWDYDPFLFVYWRTQYVIAGVEKEPEGISGRIGTFFVYLAMLFIYTSYSANIVALLQSSASINTLEEFVQSPLTAGLLDFEFSRTMFENTSMPIRRLVYEKKIGPKGYYSYDEGVRKVRKGLFAFYGEPGSIFHYVAATFEENEKCDLQEIGTPGEIVALFCGVAHKSPLIEVFKNGLIRLEETGLQQRYFLKIYQSQPKCGNSVANFVQVGLTESYWAFVILLYGVGSAILLFLIEHSLKNQCKLKSKIRDINVVH